MSPQQGPTPAHNSLIFLAWLCYKGRGKDNFWYRLHHHEGVAKSEN